MRSSLLFIVLFSLLLTPVVLADEYVDDVYYWPYSALTTTKTQAQTTPQTSTQTLRADTIWEQPSDTVVRMTIRR